MQPEARRRKPIAISFFRPEDQLDVRRLILEGLEEHWGHLDPGLNPDLDDIGTAFAGGIVLVARQGERIVGVAMVDPVAPFEGEVKRMSVAKDVRRQGIGSELLSALVMEAKRTGCHTLRLETTADWEDAVGFYLASPFEFTHQEDSPFGPEAHFGLNLQS